MKFLTVDGYNMDERLERPSVWYTTWYQESQVSLAVTLWMSGVVVDSTFTLEGVDVLARLFTRHVNVFSRLVSTAKLF